MTRGRGLERLAATCAGAAAGLTLAAGYRLATAGGAFWVAIMLGNALVFGMLVGIYRVRRRWRLQAERELAPRAVVYRLGQNGHSRRPR